jgi:hypothetical protein
LRVESRRYERRGGCGADENNVHDHADRSAPPRKRPVLLASYGLSGLGDPSQQRRLNKLRCC